MSMVCALNKYINYSSFYTFFALYVVPSEPQDITVSRRIGRPNELEIAWLDPANHNGIILNYTIYCTLTPSHSEGPDSIVVVSGDTFSTVVTALTPYTVYECYITASTSVGEGNASVAMSALTDESGKVYIREWKYHSCAYL